MTDWDFKREAFRRDGVVHLPQVLDEEALKTAMSAFDWSLKNPGPSSVFLYEDREPMKPTGPIEDFEKLDDFTYQDFEIPGAKNAYAPLWEQSPIPDFCAKLWGTNDVWYMADQLFFKKGGGAGRTVWHQDGAYLPVVGLDAAVVWISFDHIPKENALEFVRGSHLGPYYNAPKYEETDLLPMPDIAAEPGKWDMVSWTIDPGDVLIFDFATLHGGGGMSPGRQRRTLALRFLGERAFYEPRPQPRYAKRNWDFSNLKPGDPLRNKDFIKVR